MINKLNLKFLLFSFLAFFACSSSAFASNSVEEITQKVNVILNGSGQVLSVEPVEGFKDFYEVVVQEPSTQRIMYTNGDGSRVILGSLINTQTMANLTARRMDDLNRIDFDADLDKSLAFTNVYGDGEREIAIFEDPRCGYCKQLRKQAIENLKNATVYTFVYPVLGQSSVELSTSLLCSDNPSEAWRDWMVNNKSPSKKECEVPLNTLLELGKSMGITGTPTIFFKDGSRVNGAIQAAELIRRMDVAESAGSD